VVVAMARTAEHREAAVAVGERTRRHRGFCRRFTWRRGSSPRYGSASAGTRAPGRTAGGPLDQGWRGWAACTEATRGVRGLQGSWSAPGLGKEQPREGASGPDAEAAGVARRHTGTRESAGGVAVNLPVSDWQRLTEVNSTFCNRSVPSDE
jgi:hypothetical protein